MKIKGVGRSLINQVSRQIFRLQNITKEKFECPVCGYVGPFRDINPPTGLRRHACCPGCGALERHRIQYLVVNVIVREKDVAGLSMLHFSPESFFRGIFSKMFGKYETADFDAQGVDYHVDIQKLPFRSETYDFIFASHVLEHIPDDKKALSEIRRILKPNGMAVLPVPLIAEKTIEYSGPNPNEAYHVRAPGFDYYERYKHCFSRVDMFNSDAFPAKYQLYVYEDRSQWPTKECPLRPAMQGKKHIDVVPVCYA